MSRRASTSSLVSVAAQLREQRYQLRRAARKKVEAALQALRDHDRAYLVKMKELEAAVKAAEKERRELEDRLRGRSPEITFDAQEGE